MTDREKVINGLECCAVGCRSGCPYYDIVDDCKGVLCADALAMLKAQEPRVMSRDEVFGDKIIEYKYDGATDGSFGPGTAVEEHPLNAMVEVAGYGDNENGTTCVEFCGCTNDPDDLIWHPVDEYGKTWRCWTERPTDEQRKAVKWDD